MTLWQRALAVSIASSRKSDSYARNKWACYEFQFDGAQGAVAKVWADSQPVIFNVVSNRPGPLVVQKFTTIGGLVEKLESHLGPVTMVSR